MISHTLGSVSSQRSYLRPGALLIGIGVSAAEQVGLRRGEKKKKALKEVHYRQCTISHTVINNSKLNILIWSSHAEEEKSAFNCSMEGLRVS